MLGVALGATEGASIFFRNSNEKSQSLIYRVRVWKGIRDVPIKANYITKTTPAWTEFPDTERSDIILRPQLIF